ncbi:MAG TPA: NAD-dependent DNA ligase LigA, partial [Bacteroidales bacterium]|nr:NAD-dependent DNA ligase LigA [Bacteroidales bacterium]
KAGFDDLKQAEEIGDIIAGSIIKYFSNPVNIKTVERLKQQGIQFQMQKSETPLLSDKLAGKSFVVSGVFTISRDGMKALIEKHGGRNVGSISAKTDFVLAGEKMGPEKKKKAESLGVAIISEEDFYSMIS